VKDNDMHWTLEGVELPPDCYETVIIDGIECRRWSLTYHCNPELLRKYGIVVFIEPPPEPEEDNTVSATFTITAGDQVHSGEILVIPRERDNEL